MSKAIEFERLPGVHILLVDDNRDARNILETVLTYCGALVTPVANAMAALRLLRHIRPHIIISDLAMPGKDGLWLIKAVRDLKPDKGGDTPALAISAYDDHYGRPDILTAGYQDFLVKPLDLRELCRVVDRLRR